MKKNSECVSSFLDCSMIDHLQTPLCISYMKKRKITEITVRMGEKEEIQFDSTDSHPKPQLHCNKQVQEETVSHF